VPSRAEVAALIKARWSELTARNSDLAFDLHYLEDGIEIDLIAESSADTAFAQTLAEQLVSVDWRARSSAYCVTVSIGAG